MNSRSLIPVGLTALFLGVTPGCKKNEPPKPEPEATSASAAAARTRANTRTPMNPVPRPDPQSMKDYRIDICYFGTLTLRQARDSYLASLGKDEPSEKKIPSFGIPTPPAPPGAASAGSAAAPPAPTATPVLRPRKEPGPSAADGSKSATAGAAPPPPHERRPFDLNLRAPHERNARACSAATSLKEPPMGDVDTTLAAFAPFATELAKDISATNNYYQREEYKKDGFAKGKELHKKLLDEFQKLDELQDKLGNAITAWRKDHRPDPSKQDEGEKVVVATLDDAREVLLAVIPKKIDGLQPKLDKLDKSVASLKEYNAAHAADTWSKIMIGPFDAFLKTAKEAKLTPNGLEPDTLLNLITNFSSLIEARQRAISRAMMLKGVPLSTTASPSAGLPAGHPVPTPAQPPQ